MDPELIRLLAMLRQGQTADASRVATGPKPKVPERGRHNPVLNFALEVMKGFGDAINENPIAPFNMIDVGEGPKPSPTGQTLGYTAGSLMPDMSDPVLGPAGDLMKAGFKALPASVAFFGPGREWLERAKGLLRKVNPDAAIEAASNTAYSFSLYGYGPGSRTVVADVLSAPYENLPQQLVGGVAHNVRVPNAAEADVVGVYPDMIARRLKEDRAGLPTQDPKWFQAEPTVAAKDVAARRLQDFAAVSPLRNPVLTSIVATRGFARMGNLGGGSDFIKIPFEVYFGETTPKKAARLLGVAEETLTPGAIEATIHDLHAFGQFGLSRLGLDLEEPLLVWRVGPRIIQDSPLPVSLVSDAFSRSAAKPYVVDPKRVWSDVEFAIGDAAGETELLVSPRDLHPATFGDYGGKVWIREQPNGLWDIATSIEEPGPPSPGMQYSPELSASIAQAVPGDLLEKRGLKHPPTFGSQRDLGEAATKGLDDLRMMSPSLEARTAAQLQNVFLAALHPGATTLPSNVVSGGRMAVDALNEAFAQDRFNTYSDPLMASLLEVFRRFNLQP